MAGGYISARVGATVKELPTLKIRAARAWRQEFLAAAASVGSTTLTLDLKAIVEKAVASAEGFGPLAQIGSDRILDLVVAYDVGGVLGTRDWLESEADDAELYTVFRAILGVVFPFASDLRSGLGELMTLWRNVVASNPSLARSIASSFTSGSPAITDSTPPGSKKPSTKTRS